MLGVSIFFFGGGGQYWCNVNVSVLSKSKNSSIWDFKYSFSLSKFSSHTEIYLAENKQTN